MIDGLKGKSIKVGAQNAAVESKKVHSPVKLRRVNWLMKVRPLVLVGHSERRQIMGERDETLIRKFAAAQACGLIPVLCVGETLEEREAGKTLEVVGRQLGSIIEELGVGVFAKAVIAYEPVWAIGTGLIVRRNRRRMCTQPFALSWRQRILKSRKVCGFYTAAA